MAHRYLLALDALTTATAPLRFASFNSAVTAGASARGAAVFTGGSVGAGQTVALLPGSQDFGFGFRTYFTNANMTNLNICRWYNGSDIHGQLYSANGSGELRLAYGPNDVGTGIGLHYGVEYHFEVATHIDDSPNGSVKLAVNGKEVTSVTASGVDTKTGSTTLVTAVRFGASGSGNAFLDIILRDDISGFMGDVRLDTVFPTGDSATYTNFTGTPSTTPNKWQNVDEVGPNTTDYNYSSTVTDKDTFTHGGVSLTNPSILAVQVCCAAHKNDAGAREMRAFLRSGATDGTPGTAVALAALTNQYLYALYSQDPNAGPGAWNQTTVNAAEIGYELSA